MKPSERYQFSAPLSAPVEPQGDADLYHVTRPIDTQTIFRQGLLKDSDSPAAKMAEENTPESESPHIQQDPKDVRADREFDETIQNARRRVAGTDRFPSHRDAVFAWPRIKNARNAAFGMKGRPRAIVHIDSSKMPECTFAAAPSRALSRLWEGIYNTFSDFARESDRIRREEAFERAQDWWETVEMYDPDKQYRKRYEVWTGCNVPPEAIVKITDPDREVADDRPILQPPREGEQTIRDFAAPGRMAPLHEIIEAEMPDGGRNPRGQRPEDGFRAPDDRSTVYRVGDIVLTEVWIRSFSIDRGSGGLGTGLYAYATPGGVEAAQANDIAGAASDDVYELPGILENPLFVGKHLNGRDRKYTHRVHDFAGILSVIARREAASSGYIDNFPEEEADLAALSHKTSEWVNKPEGTFGRQDPVTDLYNAVSQVSRLLGEGAQETYERALAACREAARQDIDVVDGSMLQPLNFMLYPEYDGLYPAPSAGGDSNKWGVCVFKQRIDDLLGRDVPVEEPIAPSALERALEA